MADTTEPTSKRARLDEGGIMGAARKSFRNIRSLFMHQGSGVELRAKEHESVPAFRPEGRFVPRYVNMDPIKDHPARMQSFERVMQKIEAAVARANTDLRCNQAECVTDPAAVNEGKAYTIKLRYGRVATHGHAEPFMIDLESLWSVSQFDADLDLKTVLIPFSFRRTHGDADELEFSLVFRSAPPVDV